MSRDESVQASEGTYREPMGTKGPEQRLIVDLRVNQ
jgi:hypothetical protein